MNNRLGYYQIRVMLVDGIAAFFAAIMASYLPHADLGRSGILLISLLHFFAFYIADLGKAIDSRGAMKEFERTIRYTVIFSLILTFSSFMLEEKFQISRKGLVYFLVVNFVLVYVTNTIIKKYKKVFLGSVYQYQNTLVVTTAKRWRKMLAKQDGFSFPIDNAVGLVVMDGIIHIDNKGIPLISAEEAMQFATRAVVDHVFINLPSEEYRLEDLVSGFELLGIDVSVNINALHFRTAGNKKIQQVGSYNVVTFSTNFYQLSHVVMKRILDIVGAVIGLLICGLAGIVLIPLIKKDGGPAIFSQERVGKNGRIFKFYKFRSMYIDAEERKKDLMAQNQMQGGMFKMENDPRITPIGHFIRKTSLDELPQFYNVLRGDMSLVGTRPPTVDEYSQYTPSQKRRLSFKPGITGLWQVSGRSEITNFDDVVKLDVAYIDNWTIWSDIKILLKTIKVVVMKEGAK